MRGNISWKQSGTSLVSLFFLCVGCVCEVPGGIVRVMSVGNVPLLLLVCCCAFRYFIAFILPLSAWLRVRRSIDPLIKGTLASVDCRRQRDPLDRAMLRNVHDCRARDVASQPGVHNIDRP